MTSMTRTVVVLYTNGVEGLATPLVLVEQPLPTVYTHTHTHTHKTST
jgi:hypothetical protein